MRAMSRIIPYLLYEDAAAGIDWLGRAFGFRERDRTLNADGNVSHAELERADGGMIMLGCPGPHYKNPKRLGQVTQSLYVYVDDVEEVFARARDCGGVILEEPADQPYGDRRCGLEDPEGHRWYFAQRNAR